MEPSSDGPDRQQRSGGWRSGWARWIGLPISALAILILAYTVDLSAAVDILTTAELAPLVGATALIAVQIALVTGRWRLLLPRNPEGHRPRYLSTARALLVGYLGNFVLPARLGEAVRAYLVARLESLPLTGSFASVILERVVDTASIAVIATIVAIALGAEPWVVQVTAIVAAAAVLAFVVVAFGLLGVVSGWILRLAPSGWRVRMVALSATLDDFSRGLSVGGRWRTILVVLAISLVSWVLEAGVYYLVAQSLDITQIGLLEAFLIAAVTVLATAIPSAPAYLGTFELAATSVTVAVAGVPEAEALAFAILVHLTTVIPLAVGGIVALSTIGLGLRPLARMASEAESERREDETPRETPPDSPTDRPMAAPGDGQPSEVGFVAEDVEVVDRDRVSEVGENGNGALDDVEAGEVRSPVTDDGLSEGLGVGVGERREPPD